MTRAIVEGMVDDFHYRVRIPVLNKIAAAIGATPVEELSIATIAIPPGVSPKFRSGDMGFEAFAEIAHAATDKFNVAIETVGMKLSDIFNGGSDSSGAGRGQAKAKDMSGSGSGADQKASGNTENVQIVADKSNKTRKQDDDSEEMRDLDQTNYQYTTREERNRAFIDSEKIDAEVDKGRRMEDSAQKK